MNLVVYYTRLASSLSNRPVKGCRPLLLAVLLNGLTFSVFAQSIGIAGPQCVIAGPVYLYNITAQWQPGSTVRVCVTGGTLVDSGATCAGGNGILSFVRVRWDSGGQSTGTVAVTSSLGNTSLSVSLTTPLSGGQIDSSVAYQSLDTLTTPATLTVSAATGGACQPAYGYQWQQSADNLHWSVVPGATGAQFSFSGPLTQTGYFRRVVTDNAGNMVVYSNVAVIIVNKPMAAPVNPSTTQP
jgi:hypothetical protein